MTPGVSSLSRVWDPLLDCMKDHPCYEDQFILCHEELFNGCGPLRKSDRHYIALMAAARHRCSFLINLHEREFEAAGGNLQWLKGFSCVDCKKLLLLDEINRYLAHQPWLINKDVITRITRGAGDGSNTPHFSLSEMVHAVVILAHTHSLCSFVDAVGAVPTDITSSERASMAVRCEWLARDKENAGGANRKGEVDELLARMDRMRAAAEVMDLDDEDDDTTEKSMEHFNALHDGNDESSGNGGDSPTSAGDGSMLSSFQRYSEQLSFSYIDFQTRNDSSKTFKIHEFSWEQHGCVIVEELYRRISPLLDTKFSLTQILTYKTMGAYADVDTTAYRMAVWNYIQALYGIRHDDYDYAEVNALLSREMKTFVKTVACFPHRVTDQTRNAVMPDFKASEKVHVMIMIMEARLQAAMLYVTRALTNYYSSDRRAGPM